jgi:hypothetical protein
MAGKSASFIGVMNHAMYINAEEMGLFFNVLPDRTLAYEGESCHGGKHSKDRLTVLLCVNSVGSDKQVSNVIGKSPKLSASR